MAITTKRITMRQGNEADWKPEKMLSAEMAVIKDKKELHFAYADGKTKRVATEDDISKLSGQIPNQGGTGLSTEAIDKLEELKYHLAFVTSNGGTKWDELITILRGGTVNPDEPDEPVTPDNPEVTLTSISATYTGGEVTVGTALTSLTGITVTGHYSDGSTTNVTGYILSGEIVEGANTITVSYGGKTTSITVTGVAESGGDEPTERTLLYNWDLTKSLVDTVHGKEAVINGSDCAITENGLSITGATSYCLFSETIEINRTYEVDIVSYDRKGIAHGRTVMLTDNAGLSMGFIYRSTGKWAVYDGTWKESEYTDSSYMDGKTVKFTVKDSEITGRDYSIDWYIENQIICSTDSSLNSQKGFAIGSGAQGAYDLVVSAVRVYEGV